jgi:hypothetical protein
LVRSVRLYKLVNKKQNKKGRDKSGGGVKEKTQSAPLSLQLEGKKEETKQNTHNIN